MKVLTVSYRHTQKRTINYQSVESCIEATAAVDEGEKASGVVKELAIVVRQLVKADVHSAVKELTAPVAAPAPVAANDTPAPGKWGMPSATKATKDN